MKTLTKRILLSALTFCTALCGAMVTVSWKAFADDPVTFETAEFTVRQEAYVRIGSNEDGSQFDYTKNGIRFTAEIDANAYETLQKDAQENGYTITYGILIAPYDYHLDVPLTEESVFGGEEAEYDFVGIKTKIANVTTNELAKGDGVYYYNASMVNLKKENVARQFVAVSYMMKQTELVEGSGGYEVDYNFCEGNEYARSMSYVAQKALEKDYSLVIKNALQESYIKGQTTLVDVECQKYYGETLGATVSQQIELSLGAVSADEVAAALAEKGVVDGFTLSNGEEIGAKTVYADGNTETLTLQYQA